MFVMTNEKRTPIKGNPLQRSPTKSPGIQRIVYMSSINEKIIKKKREKRKKTATDGKDEVSMAPMRGEQETPVPRKVYLKWKPLQPSSSKYVTNIINEHCSTELSKVVPKSYDDVNDTLTVLKARAKKKISPLHAPTPLSNDYAKMQRLCLEMEEQLESNIKQMDDVDKEIQRLERITEDNEEETHKQRQLLQELQDVAHTPGT